MAETVVEVKQNLIMTWKGTDYGKITYKEEGTFKGYVNEEGKRHGRGFVKN